MAGIIDNFITSGLFTSLILLPGFLSIFFPFKLLGIKIRHSDFELTLFSLLISILIFGLSVITHQIVNLISPVIVDLNFKEMTIIGFMTNSIFLTIYILYVILFIFLGFFFISKDRLQKFRKFVTGRDIILLPDEYVWDKSFETFPGYYHIVETNNNETFYGHAICCTTDLKEKELLLKYPHKYDVTYQKYIPLEDQEAILFLDADIRRIHFIKPRQKE